MPEDTNPYVAPAEDTGRSSSGREPSTWRRNFGALRAIVLTYCSIAAVFAVSRHSLPPPIVYPLLLAAFCCSTWANFQIGPRIGWSQGGLPIMIVLVFGWTFAYVITSLIGADVVYWILDPDRLLH
ncbi:hypothetical protein CGZ80_02390 [Rhodopirellula sp. MGV]|nr:hypothetical protein CGZ80_02390 [Rhodopirellula sp. MGV]PNY34170.1 hypothetical protein C2E31_24445 [Rhodopirellula baltica]